MPPTMLRALSCLLMLWALGLAGCDSEEPTPDDPPPPCGGQCASELCFNNVCLADNSANPDQGGDADVEPGDMDAEDETSDADVPEEDASDVPDVDTEDVSDADLPDEDDGVPDADMEDDADLSPPDVPDGDTPQADCFADGDCNPGQICDDTLEVAACREGCREDGDCTEEGDICDEGTLVCREGCRNNDACPQGFLCNRSEAICEADTCERDDQCRSTQYCSVDAELVVCLPGCRFGECDPGQFCDPDTRVCQTGECGDDSECAEGLYCLEQSCVEGCRDSASCEPGQLCVDVDVPELGLRQRCQEAPCEDDAVCPDDFYCGDQGSCLEGCRVAPDNCPTGGVCDPETRFCLGLTCTDDSDCFPGNICNTSTQPGLCEPGCVNDASCPDGLTCQQAVGRCDCDAEGQCPSGQTCIDNLFCDLRCASDDQCGGEEICDAGSASCRSACDSDEACPVGLFCNQDAARPVCETGCRQGECPEGTLCALDSRQCQTACDNDEACPEGEYCEQDSGACLPGCRNGDDCELDQVCILQDGPDGPRQTCEDQEQCNDDQDCLEGAYCGLDLETLQVTCLEGCRLEEGACPEGDVCHPELRQCQAICAADSDCPEGQRCRQEGSCFLPTDCEDDIQCPSGAWCDQEQRDPQCEPGCSLDLETCGEARACDPLTRRCETSCADTACPDGFTCTDEEVCLPLCQDSAQCPDGEVCVEALPGRALCTVVEDECQRDDDCPDSDYCHFDLALQSNICLVRCDGNSSTCPSGQSCDTLTSRCELACEDGQCPDGLQCNPADNVCVPRCINDLDCPVGQLCAPAGPEETRCVTPEPDCDIDADCDAEQWCQRHPRAQVLLCQDGCRTSPDNCPASQGCNVSTRECITLECATNEACPEPLACTVIGDVPSCRAGGCLEDGDCMQDETCTPDLSRCTCEAGMCPQGQACVEGLCEDQCDASSDCAPEQTCLEDLGVCVLRCAEDEDCGAPESALFCDDETDTCQPQPCEEDAACPSLFYCQDGACAEGCQEGDCEEGFFCDLVSRECTEACQDDEDCGAPDSGLTCNVELGQCLRACPTLEGCAPGELCLPMPETQILICEPQAPNCDSDADCGPLFMCDATTSRCLPGCRVDPDNCGQGLACNPSLGICEPDGSEPEPCTEDSQCPGAGVTCNVELGQCEQASCVNDEACQEGLLCQRIEGEPVGVCVVGCREDSSCLSQMCQTEFQVCICEQNDQCNSGEICDFGFCVEDLRPPCTQALDCRFGETCVQEVEGQFCTPACEDDDLEPNDSIEAPSMVELGVLEDLRACDFVDDPAFVPQDCYQLSLAEAGQLAIEVHFNDNLGMMNVSLYGPDQAFLEVSEQVGSPQSILYPMAQSGDYIYCISPVDFGPINGNPYTTSTQLLPLAAP